MCVFAEPLRKDSYADKNDYRFCAVCKSVNVVFVKYAEEFGSSGKGIFRLKCKK